MKGTLDELLRENGQLNEVKKQENQELRKAKDLRKIRKNEAEEVTEKLKRAKGI